MPLRGLLRNKNLEISQKANVHKHHAYRTSNKQLALYGLCRVLGHTHRERETVALNVVSDQRSWTGSQIESLCADNDNCRLLSTTFFIFVSLFSFFPLSADSPKIWEKNEKCDKIVSVGTVRHVNKIHHLNGNQLKTKATKKTR